MSKRWMRFAFVTSGDKNLGYLLMRLLLGTGLVTHGYGKFTGGIERWEKLGSTMGRIGIKFFPAFWGFMAAFAEFIGGILLILGVFTTLASFLCVCTMLVASFVAHSGGSFSDRELALFYLVPSFMYMVKGAGAYSIDNLMFGASGSSKEK